MDIQQLSTDMAQTKLMTDVSTAVLAKSLESTKAQGVATQQLIQNSAPQSAPVVSDPALGSRVNLLA